MKNILNKELKPCPFCNGEADGMKIGAFWSVFCKKCNCEMVECKTQEEAFTMWNRRS